MRDQALAVGLEREALVMALKQLGAEQLLQALELLADGGLGETERLAAPVTLPVSTTATKRAEDRFDIAAHGLLALLD